MNTINSSDLENNYRNCEVPAISGFIKTWVIVGLVLSSFRLLFAPLSVVGYFAIEDGDPMKFTVIPEILSHFILLILGLWANISILMRKKIGYVLGKANVVGISLSIVLGVLQTAVMVQSNDQKNVLAMIVGASFTMIIRIVLIVFYGLAIKKYGQLVASVGDTCAEQQNE